MDCKSRKNQSAVRYVFLFRKPLFCFLFPFLLCAAFFLCGCSAISQRGETAGSADEEAIRSVLSAYEDAWNRRDREALLSLLHEEFIVWESGRRKIVYSRAQYAYWLSDIMRRHRYIKIVTPAVWMRNDRATVHIGMLVDGRSTRNIFHLIRVNGGWLIIDSEF